MITIQIDDAELRRALHRLAAATSNLRPAMADIGELVTASTKARFVTSTAPDGSAWEPLSETTLLRYLQARGGLSRRRTATGGRTLTQRGQRALAQRLPLVGESKRLSREIAPRVGAQQVQIGTNLEYAGTHQFGAAARSFTGGRNPWGDVPARPFLGLSAADSEGIQAALREHLAAALGAGR